MEKGMKVKLVKEPDNEYDKEAIQVKIKRSGEVRLCGEQPLYGETVIVMATDGGRH